MNFLRLTLVALSLICPISVGKVLAQDDDNPLPVKILPVTPEIELAMSNAMKNCPSTGSKIHAGINKNGVYTLSGNLFHNGQTNVLVDNTNNIILGELKGKKWNATAVINAAPTWNSPPYNDDLLALASSKPFWLLWLQGSPFLVVASTQEKINQNFAILLLDPKTGQLLDSCSSYQDKPTIKDGFLVCYEGSRNKSEWETTYFYKIQNGKFNLIASSGSNSPWRSDAVQEPVTYTVKTKKNTYVFIDYSASTSLIGADGKDKKPLGGGIDTIHISHNDKPYAIISFNLENIRGVRLRGISAFDSYS